MHKLLATGNIGQNAIIRDGQSGQFITFTVAVNKKYKNRDGVDVEKTTWYNCIYQPKSTAVAQYLTSGQKVLIEGEPDSGLYQNKQGEWKIDNTVNVRSIELLGSANQDDKPAAATIQANTGQLIENPVSQEEPHADLPF